MHRLRPFLLGSICTLGLFCLSAVACRTNSPDPADARGEDTTVAEAPPSDTSTAAPDSAERSNPPPPPAPGTARVRAEIVTCNAAAEPVRCEVRVEEVLGYGSATPSLGTGTRPVNLASSLLVDRDVAALDTLGTRTLILRHAGDRPTLGTSSDEERPEWTIQTIEP